MQTTPRPASHPRRDRAARRLLAPGLAACLLVALAGCGDEVDDVAVAQANVTAKQNAVADAEAQAAATAQALCSASSTYITALDRYGDILNDTAPTVGDVTDAGQDLVEPREATVEAAEAAQAAREDLTAAEQALVEAQAALAAAEAAAAGESPTAPASEATSASASPAPARLTRVEQAEADFAEAQAGIDASTPLAEAAEQFNAAAVALEMSWLALFADLGCLSDEQAEQAAAAIAAYTAALQQDLADAGYYEGEVDGVYGPETVAAVEALQEANDLPRTGTVDKATEAALRAELAAAGGVAAAESTASTAAVQQTLKLAGYWDGPVDGAWSDALTEALQQFQEDLGVEPTGSVDAATITAFNEALAAAQQTPSPSESPESPSPSPEATSTPAQPVASASPAGA
jgi:peptidoglycan hydrolase-like protein with peptidoglycan-binding domain